MSKIYDAIMGLAVADALGVPYEFRQRDAFKATGMIGYGTHGQPMGTWSDDTSMTLATISSLCECGEIDLEDIAAAFAQWLKYAHFTPWGEVFDIGRTTQQAILRWLNGYDEDQCGLSGEQDNGNGSLMRILPLAFLECTDRQISEVSALTHAHPVSMDACIIYITIAKNLLHGVPLPDAIYLAAGYSSLPEFDRLPTLWALRREDIRSSGYVVDTLEAALWCLLNTDSYRDCVLTAVNLGDDTDTVAAVAGGLAGIVYGIGGARGVPQEWVEKTTRRSLIVSLCEWFDETFGDRERAHERERE